MLSPLEMRESEIKNKKNKKTMLTWVSFLINNEMLFDEDRGKFGYNTKEGIAII